MAAQPATSEWLQEQLSTLLASPHIHFSHPKFPGAHMRMGPGPIDVFSTKFANMFTSDATGTVAGTQVDKDGLKESLLALQKQWNPDSAKFVPMDPPSADYTVRSVVICPHNILVSSKSWQMATSFSWTPKQSETSLQVGASASVQEEGGLQRINVLNLDGDPSMFASADAGTQ
ncbi:hypothetical protein PHLCEN_2v7297 [Hermanssonia centrifuga]|uniref:Uncharacterized protein n=1 Tax=Hermanssonia centrifuga TaxID=98765 RepID=A0A2R6NWX9_9APHY|nr:hypothetical protein PHLCEN_2v7297 [Hermanssonia centrifuga]